jgi:hypothetical protein
MPCMDVFADREAAEEAAERKIKLEDKVDFLEAALCAAMKALDGDYSRFNFEEAGIKKEELRNWWHNHRRKDERRLARNDKKSKDSNI